MQAQKPNSEDSKLAYAGSDPDPIVGYPTAGTE